MGEHEWLIGGDPAAMLDHALTFASERKLRLFACGCLRRHWALLKFVRQRQAVEYAERWADGVADADARPALEERLQQDAADPPAFEAYLFQAAVAVLNESAAEAARQCRELTMQHAVHEEANGLPAGVNEARYVAAARAAEGRGQCGVLRELLGNPFRPPALRPEWLSASGGAARHLARLIADEGRFGELGILADALEDGGCDDEALVRHLREPAGHLRGCWGLDAVRGVV
ncbi:MAG: hypothetical protein ACRC33_14405 [Gemmataceae bacterium]